MEETGLDGGTKEVLCDVIVDFITLGLYTGAADGRRKTARAGEELREMLAAARARAAVAEAAAGFGRRTFRPLETGLGVTNLTTSGQGC